MKIRFGVIFCVGVLFVALAIFLSCGKTASTPADVNDQGVVFRPFITAPDCLQASEVVDGVDWGPEKCRHIKITGIADVFGVGGGVEIGFREDGVVVWRGVKEK